LVYLTTNQAFCPKELEHRGGVKWGGVVPRIVTIWPATPT